MNFTKQLRIRSRRPKAFALGAIAAGVLFVGVERASARNDGATQPGERTTGHCFKVQSAGDLGRPTQDSGCQRF